MSDHLTPEQLDTIVKMGQTILRETLSILNRIADSLERIALAQELRAKREPKVQR